MGGGGVKPGPARPERSGGSPAAGAAGVGRGRPLPGWPAAVAARYRGVAAPVWEQAEPGPPGWLCSRARLLTRGLSVSPCGGFLTAAL